MLLRRTDLKKKKSSVKRITHIIVYNFDIPEKTKLHLCFHMISPEMLCAAEGYDYMLNVKVN